MKRLISLITLCISILGEPLYAQNAKFGISVGSAISSYKLKAEGISVTSKGKGGITIGLFSDIPLASSISFMPALNFVQKGGTIKHDDLKDKLTTNYLEVPLNFAYKAKLGSGRFFIGAGPSLNIGISGKDEWEVQGNSGNEKVKFGKDKDFRRFDAGLNVVTGIYFKAGTMVALNYNTGLTSSVDNGGDEGKFLKRYFGIRLGYIL